MVVGWGGEGGALKRSPGDKPGGIPDPWGRRKSLSRLGNGRRCLISLPRVFGSVVFAKVNFHTGCNLSLNTEVPPPGAQSQQPKSPKPLPGRPNHAYHLLKDANKNARLAPDVARTTSCARVENLVSSTRSLMFPSCTPASSVTKQTSEAHFSPSLTSWRLRRDARHPHAPGSSQRPAAA